MKLKNLINSILACLFLLSCNVNNQNASLQNDLELWDNESSKIWEDYYPIGNGRLGAMPSGDVYKETIVLNDITMWSGSFDSTQQNPTAKKYLPKIRTLLQRGKNKEAQDLVYKHFLCGGKGSGQAKGADIPFGTYQILGNLKIEHDITKDSIKNYKRGLLLKDAIAYTSFSIKNTEYRREYFVSHSNDVIVIKLSSNKSNKIGFTLSINRPQRYFTYVSDNDLYMEGELNSGQKNVDGVRYKTRIKVLHEDGTLEQMGKNLKLQKATTAYILISSSTNMLDSTYEKTVDELLVNAQKTTYEELKNKHIEAYQKKFNRVELNLAENDNSLPTKQRLIDFQQNDDPALVALYFQYGRYLMISGTRENSLPLNLQGLWANTINTPWNGDYHLNINVQMNYWPVEITNLSELHKPLIDFVKRLSKEGEITAKNFYDAEGWVAHVISNPWLFSAPGEDALWGSTNTGGAWLCAHLWEHYAFTQDKNYLKDIYPVMKGAAEFFYSSMIQEKDSGWLVTAPSTSPENSFYLPKTKTAVQVCMGPTMDIQIISELYKNVISATKILNIDSNFAVKLDSALQQFPPMQISPNGYLQEWLKDYEEVELNHRHVSHLYGLYPSNQISVEKTPALAEAAKETLNRRGDEGTGWSRAWKINFWARLQDGERSYSLLKSLLNPAISEEVKYHTGGTYPNLFCSHPPFQIDGNFGGCAGIAEMLIQSQNGYIEVLPSIPQMWNGQGSFKGLKVRGGATVDAVWDKNTLIFYVTANTKNDFVIKKPKGFSSVTIHKEGITLPIGKEVSFIPLQFKAKEKVVISCKK